MIIKCSHVSTSRTDNLVKTYIYIYIYIYIYKVKSFFSWLFDYRIYIFFKIDKINNFTVYTLIKFLKFDFHIIFAVLFGVYKWFFFINFKCGLNKNLLNIRKKYWNGKEI